MSAGPVAVHVGATAVRVAGRGRVVEIAPDPSVAPAELLAGLVGSVADVVLVGEPAVLVAGPGERVVVDVGHRATRVSLVRRGTVVARRTGPGGADLDEAVARLLRCPGPDARRLREELSLHPTARAPHGATVTADEVRAVLRPSLDEIVRAVVALSGTTVAVLLVGGGARTPLLAELLDDAGLPDVVVAPQPETAVVVAAARSGHADAPLPKPPEPTPRRLGAAPALAGRPGRVLLAGAAIGIALGGLHLLGAALTPAGPEPLPGNVLAQYGYRLEVPPGWAHTGGEPERRRSLLTPLAAPEGSDLIAVEATPLGYDADAEPRRAAAELRAEFDAQAAAGVPLGGYDPAATIAGRSVTVYSEQDGETTVQWYVVLDGDAQLSVGCRHTDRGTVAVHVACTHVVGSIRTG